MSISYNKFLGTHQSMDNGLPCRLRSCSSFSHISSFSKHLQFQLQIKLLSWQNQRKVSRVFIYLKKAAELQFSNATTGKKGRSWLSPRAVDVQPQQSVCGEASAALPATAREMPDSMCESVWEAVKHNRRAGSICCARMSQKQAVTLWNRCFFSPI